MDLHKESREDIVSRVENSKYILDVSYRLITHYDSKCSHLMVLIGFDFAILSTLLVFLFDKMHMLNSGLKAFIVASCTFDFLLIIVSLWLLKNALIPHVYTVVKHEKPKKGLIYFMDIKNNLGEDEYVEILLGEKYPVQSYHYKNSDEFYFEKCIIEDCARDIYAHAEILQLKTKYVKWSFNVVTFTSIACVLTILLISAMYTLQ